MALGLEGFKALGFTSTFISLGNPASASSFTSTCISISNTFI